MTAYVALHVALLVALAFLRLRRGRVSLRVARFAIVSILAAPLLLAAGPRAQWSGAPAQVWSGVSSAGEPATAVQVLASPARPVPVLPSPWIALALLVLFSLGRHAMALRRRLRDARVVRRIGRLRIAVGGDGPFAAALGFAGFIVLDRATARDPRLRRLALRHELQHLRQRDALWAWGLAAMQPAFLWSPVARKVRAALVEIEEQSADAAIVRSGRVAAQTYASVLLDLAERGLSISPPALPALHGHSLLRRRIELLLAPATRRPSLDLALFAVALSIACAGARVTSRAVTDHRVDVARAREAAARAADPAFPLAVNDVVVDQLNRLVATPGGLAYTRAALERRPRQLAPIHDALSAERLPLQLDAVPFVETGYDNIDAGPNGAGLWQFIKPTAAHYGLQIGPDRDERMDPARESAAAARYLRDLHRRFGDWPLVLAAYTEGETRVQKVIDREGTRDVWELIRRGALNPYPAKVMAAALVIADPSLAGR